eukprot:PITA_16209
MSLHGPISPLLANLSFLRVLDLYNSHYGSIPHDLTPTSTSSSMRISGLVGLRRKTGGSSAPILRLCMSFTSMADCSAIQAGQSCYTLDTITDHASYAFDSYYHKMNMVPGSCDFNGVGTITNTDPSHGSCIFQGSVGANGTSSVNAHAHLNNASDEWALMAFRATLSLDPNMALRSWNTSVSLCSWTGVQCSLRHQRVVSLNLTDMSLLGPISPLLANLSFLRVLDLSNNSHYGSIPHDLGRLFGLRVLRLSKNQLEGPIPSTIGSCHLLELVSLSQNSMLNGSIPLELGLLRNLKFLWLGINKLTGSIPTSFGNMSSLKNLSLGYNQLHGSIPSELGRISQLNTLYLRHNYLSGKIPPSLSNCTLLLDLQLHHNQLTRHIPWEFGGRLSQLENLFLWGNKLGGEISKTLANCTHLRVLDLMINQLTGMVPVQLGQLFRLECLFLGRNQLISGSSTTLPILTALTNCSFLEQIHIGENHLTGTIPSSIQQLSRLSVFNLSHNEIGGKIPPEIGKLANLTYLNLEWNIFNGSIPSTLGRLQKLERLYLNKNKLRGSIPTEIGGIQRLGLLSLSQNKLSGQIPHSLGQLK